MGREKGSPQEYPPGGAVCRPGRVVEADPSTPFPFHHGPLFAWSSRGRGWGQGGCSEGPTCWSPTRKELAWGEFHSVILQESPGGGHSEPAVCCMLGKCRPTWWS